MVRARVKSNNTSDTTTTNTKVKLTNKQDMFCREYLIDLNAKQAAIRAGYSENTAGEMGYENLNKPYLANRIQDLLNERHKSAEITTERVLKAIGSLAFNTDELDEKANHGTQLKGLEMLAKHKNLFVDHVLEANINISITNYSDDKGDK